MAAPSASLCPAVGVVYNKLALPVPVPVPVARRRRRRFRFRACRVLFSRPSFRASERENSGEQPQRAIEATRLDSSS